MVKKKILLLDSDRDLLRCMTQMLEDRGHQVVAVADVLACLDELIEFVPDVAFVDLFIPRIGGDDFCRIIRNIDYLQQCTLVLVANSVVGEGLDLKGLGVDAWVSRENMDEMAARMLEIVNSQDERPQRVVPSAPPGRNLRRERQETRELLARNKALRMILESMSQGIVELFEDRIVYANPQALQFLGAGVGKVLGRSVSAVFPDQSWLQIAPLLAGHQSDGPADDRYLPVWLHDRHLLVNRLRIKEEAGSQIILFTDVTEIRRMESVVEAANLMDKLGAVFSGIRHEIGNPVNSLKVALDVLQKNLGNYDRETIAGFIERCLQDVAQMEYLLKALKNYNVFERPVVVPVEIDSFLSRFVPLVRDEFERRHINLVMTGSGEGGWTMADPRALHHVLLNLLINAMDAVGDRRDGQVSISVGQSGGWVDILVEDNGCGMSEDEQRNLFRPFFTSKQQGTGLGLVIVDKIVRQMNGRLAVKSSKGVGTIVTISLPWAVNEASALKREGVAGFMQSAERKEMGGHTTGRSSAIRESE